MVENLRFSVGISMISAILPELDICISGFDSHIAISDSWSFSLGHFCDLAVVKSPDLR